MAAWASKGTIENLAAKVSFALIDSAEYCVVRRDVAP
ncbi:hypothetical protein CGLO_01193 [Colletotrichum gloeosporioides Cg-14]|uniref:Uncharacterized protein n=1 Tax=Colletotrichum gloeosporioides (strain Cg-14) TaxID=1237896 RepID=T0KSR6_COLGC|nr:hypothetical protein CGLO_01193 [Colletotrichum gloeosporioides Cg-14]